MDPEVRFQRIEALLHAMAERENQIEIRFNRRMDRSEARIQLAMNRMDKAEKRMELSDKRLEATRKLVVAGIKMVTDIARRQKVNESEIRELRKSQQAFLDSLRRGNGNGHR